MCLPNVCIEAPFPLPLANTETKNLKIKHKRKGVLNKLSLNKSYGDK